MALQAAVEGAPTATAPEAPQPGQCWVVAPGAAGDWAGRENQIASWTAGGWRFVEPTAGFTAWDLVSNHALRWEREQLELRGDPRHEADPW